MIYMLNMEESHIHKYSFYTDIFPRYTLNSFQTCIVEQEVEVKLVVAKKYQPQMGISMRKGNNRRDGSNEVHNTCEFYQNPVTQLYNCDIDIKAIQMNH